MCGTGVKYVLIYLQELDSFVVDNNFVEYETEYLGDSMMAEDPIIHQVNLSYAAVYL